MVGWVIRWENVNQVSINQRIMLSCRISQKSLSYDALVLLQYSMFKERYNVNIVRTALFCDKAAINPMDESRSNTGLNIVDKTHIVGINNVFG